MKTNTHNNFTIFKLPTILFFLTIFLSTSLSIHSQSHAAEKMTDKEFKAALIKLLKDEPEIIFNVLGENSTELINTITIASEKARTAKLEAEWKKDLQVPKNLDLKNRPMLGTSAAKNTIVGYSDFLCSYCAQGARTIQVLLNKRNDTQFIFKSIPTNDISRIATRWFFQINKEDSKKAWQFHDSIFANQKAFAANPIPVIKEIAKKLGIDVNAMEKSINANQKNLDAIINADIQEANKMKFSGTPYFVVNNVSLRGAYPLQTFEEAIAFTNKNK